MSSSVSEQLKDAIVASGVSQAEIARETGIDRGVLSRFNRGERGISDATFSKLCEFFNLELRTIQRRRK